MKQEFYKMGYEDWDEGVECFGVGQFALALEAAYLRLCHLLYRRRGLVTSDIHILAALWRVPVDEAKELLDGLQKHGKIQELDSGHLVNTRVTKELNNRGVLSAKRADAGKVGGVKSRENATQDLFSPTILNGAAIASTDLKQNPQSRVEEEVEKENIDFAPRAKKSKKGFLEILESWNPNEADREYAKGKHLTDSDIATQAESFRDYHLKKGSEFKSWAAAWREWVRRSIEYGKVKLAPEISNEKPAYELPIHGERVTDSMCPTPLMKKNHLGKVFILYDTDPWHAWLAFYHDEAKRTGAPAPIFDALFFAGNGNKGWSFPGRWPPGHKKAK